MRVVQANNLLRASPRPSDDAHQANLCPKKSAVLLFEVVT
jgi:hypothetical protein